MVNAPFIYNLAIAGEWFEFIFFQGFYVDLVYENNDEAYNLLQFDSGRFAYRKRSIKPPFQVKITNKPLLYYVPLSRGRWK